VQQDLSWHRSGTGSGKSSLQSYLINEYITQNEDYNNRVYLIEDTQD
jgi:Flp pilus assembly CpaF family ATPase